MNQQQTTVTEWFPGTTDPVNLGVYETTPVLAPMQAIPEDEQVDVFMEYSVKFGQPGFWILKSSDVDGTKSNHWIKITVRRWRGRVLPARTQLLVDPTQLPLDLPEPSKRRVLID